jgi:AcrR family transcriptional regulator
MSQTPVSKMMSATDITQCSSNVSRCHHFWYPRGVVRWQPNARGRLEQAAMQLYRDRGFEQTTVADIAQCAGLTERTFFRYFADKPEVLFSGAAALQELMVNAAAAASESAGPLEAAAAALDAAARLLQERREFSRYRQKVIAANPELQERELKKMASLATALAEALRQRGVGEPAASLAAEMAIAVFRLSFERWLDEDNRRSLPQLMQDHLRELKGLTVSSAGPDHRGRRRAL